MLPFANSHTGKESMRRRLAREIIADAVDHNTLRATKPFGQVLARVRASEIESGSARASGRKVFGVAGSRRIILPGGSGPATRYAVRRHLSLEAQSRRVAASAKDDARFWGAGSFARCCVAARSSCSPRLRATAACSPMSR